MNTRVFEGRHGARFHVEKGIGADGDPLLTLMAEGPGWDDPALEAFDLYVHGEAQIAELAAVLAQCAPWPLPDPAALATELTNPSDPSRRSA